MLKFLRSLITGRPKIPRPKAVESFHGSTTNPQTLKFAKASPEQLADQSQFTIRLLEDKKIESRQKLIRQLRLHEGERLRPYRCTAGKLTIGIGRNLEDRGITQNESAYLLSNDLDYFTIRLEEALPWMVELDEVRQRVLIDMAFNLGISGLLSFKRTLEAVKEGNYVAASDMMLDSRWAAQVHQRAITLSDMMETGEDPDEFL